MILTKQVKREAKQLFRLCLVGGILDEHRVRQVVENTIDTRFRRRHGCAHPFSAPGKTRTARNTPRMSRVRRHCRTLCDLLLSRL